MNKIFQFVLIAFLSTIFLQYVLFVNNPEILGKVFRQFDEARYEQIDCDCTGELKE